MRKEVGLFGHCYALHVALSPFFGPAYPLGLPRVLSWAISLGLAQFRDAVRGSVTHTKPPDRAGSEPGSPDF